MTEILKEAEIVNSIDMASLVGYKPINKNLKSLAAKSFEQGRLYEQSLQYEFHRLCVAFAFGYSTPETKEKYLDAIRAFLYKNKPDKGWW